MNNTDIIHIHPAEHKFPVMEIFGPTIQGEGALVGVPTLFVRLGGCTFNCSWCDTLYAVDPQQVKEGRTMMTPTEIIERLEDMAPTSTRWVTISGGDPMIHKHLHELVHTLQDADWLVALETQGAVLHKTNEDMRCDHVTLSPKPPSSGMAHDFELLRKYMHLLETEVMSDSYCVKIVVFDAVDVQWANNTACKLQLEELYLQVGTRQDPTTTRGIREMILTQYNWLINEVLRDFGDAGSTQYKYPKLQNLASLCILPQLHTLTWPNERCK